MLEVILILIIVVAMLVLLPGAKFTATRLGPDTEPPEKRYDTKI